MKDGTIGYIKEKGNGVKRLDDTMSKFKDTKGIIVDLRYAQPALIAYSLPQYLLSKSKKYWSIYSANRFIPGAFAEKPVGSCGRGAWGKNFRIISKRKNLREILSYSDMMNNGIINTWRGKERRRPMYKGRVVVIIDERTMSKYELAALAIRKCPNSIIIGTGTVGANGAATEISLVRLERISGKRIDDIVRRNRSTVVPHDVAQHNRIRFFVYGILHNTFGKGE